MTNSLGRNWFPYVNKKMLQKNFKILKGTYYESYLKTFITLYFYVKVTRKRYISTLTGSRHRISQVGVTKRDGRESISSKEI